MISDPEIYRAAHQLIGQHGDKAVERATDRARELAERNEPEGAAGFVRIARAICDLELERRPGQVVQ